MIGWRGPLGLAIGGMMIVFGLLPPSGFAPEPAPPAWFQWVFTVFGAILIWAGIAVIRFTWLRGWILKHGRPTPCTIEIFPPSDDESAIYDARVVMLEATWRVPVVGRKAAHNAVGQGPADGKAWLDPKTRSPLALERAGLWLETIPQPARENGMQTSASSVP